MSHLLQVNPKTCLNLTSSLLPKLVHVQSFKEAHCSCVRFSEPNYPSQLHALTVYINQPKFPLVLRQFLYKCHHPEEPIAPSMIEECPGFDDMIRVHHSALATFYAPSNLSGSGGLWCEWIWSAPNFFGHLHHNTAFIVINDSQPGMEGMEIGCVLPFFSFEYRCKNISCVLINWFVHGDGCDPDTEMWTVRQGFDHHGEPTLEVIHLDSIAWVAHLLPIYGQCIPEDFDYHTMLDTYSLLFVNHYCNGHYNHMPDLGKWWCGRHMGLSGNDWY